jgi:predicted PhzF superfamily epimerase YddE/YHI9
MNPVRVLHYERCDVFTDRALEGNALAVFTDAEGLPGDPMQALEDALATFDADRVVVFTHPEAERDYLEEGFVEEAERARTAA